MIEFTYHLDVESNSYPFGVLFENRLYILEENTELSSNPELLNIIDKVPSFRVYVDSGSGTARQERGYWYVYKKRKGVLYKDYLGKSARISEALLTEAVRTVNTMTIAKMVLTPVTQNLDHVPINGCQMIKPTLPYKSEPYELAGHQKNPNHLQSNLMSLEKEVTMLKQAFLALQATYDMNQTDYMILHETLRTVERDRLSIIEQNKTEVSELMNRIKNLEEALVIVCESGTDNVNRLARYREEIESLELNSEAKSQVIADKNEEILEILSNQEELELKIKRFARCLEKCDSVTAVIEKFRDLAFNKTKQQNPRFSYLLDFLADIDNLS